MLSSMNALANKEGAITPPADSPEIKQAESNNEENIQGQEVKNKMAANSEQLYSASRQLSASSETRSPNNYTGVRLDISQDMQMGVHDKTAQMVIETNVRLSIESRFEGISINQPSDINQQPGINGANKYTPRDTANRLLDFARQFMNGFLEQTESSDLEENLQEFVDEVAGAAEEGFEEAREELGSNLSAGLEKLFNELHDLFKEQLDKLGQTEVSNVEESAVANRISGQSNPSDARQAAQVLQKQAQGEENNITREIISENNRIAAGSEQIPNNISEQLLG